MKNEIYDVKDDTMSEMINCELVDVVYAWACGKEFSEIC